MLALAEDELQAFYLCKKEHPIYSPSAIKTYLILPGWWSERPKQLQFNFHPTGLNSLLFSAVNQKTFCSNCLIDNSFAPRTNFCPRAPLPPVHAGWKNQVAPDLEFRLTLRH